MRRVRGIEKTLIGKQMLLTLATLAWCACGVHGDARAGVLRQSAVRLQVGDIAAAGDASPARVAPMQLADSDGISQDSGPQVMNTCNIDGDPDEECSEAASQQGTSPATEADEAEGQLSKELDSGEPKPTGGEANAEDPAEDAAADAETEDADVEDAERAEDEGTRRNRARGFRDPGRTGRRPSEMIHAGARLQACCSRPACAR